MSSYVGSIGFKTSGFLSSFGHNDEMTAIVSTYTPDGFVIGADGLRADQNGAAIETAKKIFAVKTRKFAIAFAWRGNVRFSAKDDQSILDFSEISKEALHYAGQPSVSGFPEFLGHFCDALQALILLATGPSLTINPSILRDSSELASALLVGYFDGEPCSGEIMVRHSRGRIEKPFVQKLGVSPLNIFSGSLSMWNRFRPEGRVEEDELLSAEGGIKVVREYMQLCVENRGIDPECSDIGGHIHIVRVTPDRFIWIEPPLSTS